MGGGGRGSQGAGDRVLSIEEPGRRGQGTGEAGRWHGLGAFERFMGGGEGGGVDMSTAMDRSTYIHLKFLLFRLYMYLKV